MRRTRKWKPGAPALLWKAWEPLHLWLHSQHWVESGSISTHHPAGSLHLPPARERTVSPGLSPTRGAFLYLDLQIRKCAENLELTNWMLGHPPNITNLVCGSGIGCRGIARSAKLSFVVYTVMRHVFWLWIAMHFSSSLRFPRWWPCILTEHRPFGLKLEVLTVRCCLHLLI